MTIPLIRLLLADDDAEVAQALLTMIVNQPDMRCEGCVNTAEALLQHPKHSAPDVAVIDLGMLGGDYVVVIRELVSGWPKTKIVVLSGFDDQVTIDSTLDAGVWGFVSKHSNGTLILDAIRRVMAGEVVIHNPIW